MARLTRKSFKRKRILLGICMFISIAMISTGFAAWVISTDANKEVTGNVNVGTITEAQMEFIDVKLSNDSFNFEALESILFVIVIRPTISTFLNLVTSNIKSSNSSK